MNSRRLMRGPSSGLGPDITTPLRKDAAVHHSKNCVMMSQTGPIASNWPLADLRFAGLADGLLTNHRTSRPVTTEVTTVIRSARVRW